MRAFFSFMELNGDGRALDYGIKFADVDTVCSTRSSTFVPAFSMKLDDNSWALGRSRTSYVVVIDERGYVKRANVALSYLDSYNHELSI